MPTRIRAILFILTLFAFTVSAGVISLYALGYKIDFEKKKITYTGGLFLKISHSGAKVFLNSKFKGGVGFTRTLRVTNLIPRNYNVKIEKIGYHSWGKNLEVKPREVVEARNILLVKEAPQKEKILDEEILSFLISPDKKILVLKTADARIEAIKDLKNLKERITLRYEKDTSGDLELKDFSMSSKKIFLSSAKNKKYLIWDLEKNTLLPLNFYIEKPRWHSQEEDKFYFLDSEGDLFWHDVSGNIKSTRLARNIAAYNFLNSQTLVFVEKDSGILFKSDLSGQNKTQFTFTPLENVGKSQLEIFAYDPNILLLKDEALYILDNERGEFRALKSEVKYVEFSSLGKSFLFSTSNEIWVYFTEDIHVQPFRNRSDQEFILRLSEKITGPRWYTKDNEHIIFLAGKTVKITELDGRGGRNTIGFVDIANRHKSITPNQSSQGSDGTGQANFTNITYNEKDDNLYFLDGGYLWRAKIR